MFPRTHGITAADIERQTSKTIKFEPTWPEKICFVVGTLSARKIRLDGNKKTTMGLMVILDAFRSRKDAKYAVMNGLREKYPLMDLHIRKLGELVPIMNDDVPDVKLDYSAISYEGQEPKLQQIMSGLFAAARVDAEALENDAQPKMRGMDKKRHSKPSKSWSELQAKTGGKHQVPKELKKVGRGSKKQTATKKKKQDDGSSSSDESGSSSRSSSSVSSSAAEKKKKPKQTRMRDLSSSASSASSSRG